MTDIEKYEKNIRTCPVCEKDVPRSDMLFTHDCHGITMRLVCQECYENIMFSDKGYDGEYYDECDENLSEDW